MSETIFSEQARLSDSREYIYRKIQGDCWPVVRLAAGLGQTRVPSARDDFLDCY